jgi:hypothetical protein
MIQEVTLRLTDSSKILHRFYSNAGFFAEFLFQKCEIAHVDSVILPKRTCHWCGKRGKVQAVQHRNPPSGLGAVLRGMFCADTQWKYEATRQ